MKNPPLVSICCITYNHAPFIRQCLEGFMMQQTSFPFEVLIHDDASTDETADIIREYEEKYPDIIKPIYQAENQYSKGKSISITYQFPRVKGKYIAMCEGDDYWTDPYKLQKQVDFLNANLDFSICFHNVKIKNEERNIIVDDYITRNMPDVTDINQLAEENYIHTTSVMYRKNEKVNDELLSLGGIMYDYIIHMFYAKDGKIKKLQDEMAVYRVHKDGVWSIKEPKYQLQIWLSVLKKLISSFKEYDDEVLNRLKKQYAQIARKVLLIYDKEEITYRESKIDQLIKEISEITPYYFMVEIYDELLLLEGKIDKYKNNFLYKSYLKLRKVFKK